MSISTPYLQSGGPVDWLFDAWAEWLKGEIGEGTVQMWQLLLLWWVKEPSIKLSDDSNSVLYFLRGSTGWLVAVFAMVGFLVAAGRVAVQRRGEPLRAAFLDLVHLVVITFTLAAAVNLVLYAGDAYSEWLLQDIAPPDGNWSVPLGTAFEAANFGAKHVNPFLQIFVLLVLLISAFIQYMLMMFRNVVITFTVAALPLVKSASFTRVGRQAYDKNLSSLVAWIVFDPAASTWYYGNFKMVYSPDRLTAATGLFGLAAGVMALPVCLRYISLSSAEANEIGKSVAANLRTGGHMMFGATAANVRGAMGGVLGMGGAAVSAGKAALGAAKVGARRIGGWFQGLGAIGWWSRSGGGSGSGRGPGSGRSPGSGGGSGSGRDSPAGSAETKDAVGNTYRPEPSKWTRSSHPPGGWGRSSRR